MTLSTGTQLGPYEILSPLGAGGMGEVYLANDGKLDRRVAIEVLPETMTRDKERGARFEREAKLLASLNHPQHRRDSWVRRFRRHSIPCHGVC